MTSPVKIVVMFALWSVCKSDADFGPECRYNGDMCDIDPDKCIREMRENRKLIERCSDWTVKFPHKLYKNRGDTIFWLTETQFHRDNGREYFPDNLTYTIIKCKSEDWSTRGSCSRIQACCSMKLNETCTLPKKQPGEHQYIYIPLKNTTSPDNWYCEIEIAEVPEVLDWCRNENDTYCLEFDNEILRIRTMFTPLSVANYNPESEHCFFSTSTKFVPIENITTQQSRITRGVKGFSINGSGAKFVVEMPNEQSVPCSLESVRRESFVEVSSKYQRTVNDFVCSFVRTDVNRQWTSLPRCVLPPNNPEPDNIGMVVGIVVAVSTAILILLLVVIWVCKKHIKTCCPSFKNTINELPGMLTTDYPEGGIFITTDSDGNEKVSPSKENPDEITFEGSVICTKKGTDMTPDKERALQPEEEKVHMAQSAKKNRLIDKNVLTNRELGPLESTYRRDSGYQPEEEEEKVESDPKMVSSSAFQRAQDDADSGFSAASSKSNSGLASTGIIQQENPVTEIGKLKQINKRSKNGTDSYNNNGNIGRDCYDTHTVSCNIDEYTAQKQLITSELDGKIPHTNKKLPLPSAFAHTGNDIESETKTTPTSPSETFAPYLKNFSPVRESERMIMGALDDGYVSKNVI